ncbi:hypothetical protein OG339_47715 (plasmid) [Streptosporangium sp. NBC_01495]|uniref:hypothetical protein n=1 Tax=Streptosporangium sp. NBC_01495 TaxID=2903899 RepID=UPI002E35EFFD|nr:hypothetical protein [Streptosporangium sp. NBC_01495]
MSQYPYSGTLHDHVQAFIVEEGRTDQASEQEFTARPGLESAWLRFLHQLQFVTMPDDTLNLVDTVI